ncbi:Pyruvate formate-lyase-activating enzyme [compost metagenome]
MDLIELGKFIGSLRNVSKVELLPYHRMGVYKWQQMGKEYPLEECPTPTDKEVSRARDLINMGVLACPK